MRGFRIGVCIGLAVSLLAASAQAYQSSSGQGSTYTPKYYNQNDSNPNGKPPVNDSSITKTKPDTDPCTYGGYYARYGKDSCGTSGQKSQQQPSKPPQKQNACPQGAAC